MFAPRGRFKTRGKIHQARSIEEAGMRLFMRRRGEAGPARDAARALADLVRDTLKLDADATVSVSEISCGDPACGGSETVVLVMRPGTRTQAAKVLMPMGQVTPEALVAALKPLMAGEAAVSTGLSPHGEKV